MRLFGNAVDAGYGVLLIQWAESRHVPKRGIQVEAGHAEQRPVQNAVAVGKGISI
ncbi:hypothetical protein ANFP_07180 [Acidithiobacillus ferrooxidans]|nr:hypothetical protein ANFP_07180 [Acidithiobacillus ferrooxidans]